MSTSLKVVSSNIILKKDPFGLYHCDSSAFPTIDGSCEIRDIAPDGSDGLGIKGNKNVLSSSTKTRVVLSPRHR